MKKVLLAFVVTIFATATWAQTNMALPAGTALRVRLSRALTTFSNKVGDPFSGQVSEAVILNGQTIIPIGAIVEGKVTKVSEPRRIKGKPTIGIHRLRENANRRFALDAARFKGKPTIGILPQAVVLPGGERYPLDATLVDTNMGHGTDVNEEGQFKGSDHDRNDLAEVSAGTGGGMLAGGLIGGGPGLLIGGGIGATASTVHWLARHQSAMIPTGTELILELNRPMMMNSASGQ